MHHLRKTGEHLRVNGQDIALNNISRLKVDIVVLTSLAHLGSLMSFERRRRRRHRQCVNNVHACSSFHRRFSCEWTNRDSFIRTSDATAISEPSPASVNRAWSIARALGSLTCDRRSRVFERHHQGEKRRVDVSSERWYNSNICARVSTRRWRITGQSRERRFVIGECVASARALCFHPSA